MEYIYFARPDSNIKGVNVHTARKRMGLNWHVNSNMKQILWSVYLIHHLAQPWDLRKNLAYQMKWAIKTNIPNGPLFNPTQELREQGVRMKLSAVSGVVKGKRVVMIDDSIVRGTTSRRIVKLLKEAGATEVHVAIR